MKVAIAIAMTADGVPTVLHCGECPAAALEVLDWEMLTGEYYYGEVLWNALAHTERRYSGPALVAAPVETAQEPTPEPETDDARAPRTRKPKAAGGWAAEAAAQAAEAAMIPG